MREARRRTMRNLVATLLLSQGTPMLLAGDEWGRTQNGNNNAYCQDNPTGWVDWAIDAEGLAQEGWVRRLLALRRAHPALNRGRFFTGQEQDGVRDVLWVGPSGAALRAEDWGDPALRCFGMLVDPRTDGGTQPVLVLANAAGDPAEVTLPGSAEWERVLDSAEPERDGGWETARSGQAIQLAARSLAVFVGRVA